MIKNWLLYIEGLAMALVFLIFYFGWYSWFILVLALCLPLFSLLVSLPAMLRARLHIVSPSSCFKGDEVFASVLSAGGLLPMPVCRVRLEASCGLSGSRSVSRWKMRCGEGRELPLDTAHCGVLRFSTKGSRVYDHLGLFGLPIRQGACGETMVEPRPAPPELLPNPAQFLPRSRRPKPGGGFSEEHELRDYRPGDSPRDIHWKLSAKTDRLIVREAQEPFCGQILLTFDLRGPMDALDTVLARLIWLSGWLLEQEIGHQVLWIDPADCTPASAQVQTRDDLRPLLRRVLRGVLREDLPSMAERRFPAASWRYHVLPEQEVRP